MNKSDNLTILGRGGFTNYPDVQRDWTWVAEFPSIPAKNMTGPNAGDLSEGLLIRCKSIAIPQGNIGTLESNFYGVKQFFASKPDIGHQVSCVFEETEDLFVSKFFYNWRQMIYNINTGGSEFDSKIGNGTAGSGYGATIKLWLTQYNKTPNGLVEFERAYPTSISEVALSYDNDSKVSITVGFTFDRWQLYSGDGLTPIHAGS